MTSILEKLNACSDGQEWADDQKDYRTAWETCERGDWMLWMAAKAEVDTKTLTLVKVKCARLVQHLMKDERSLNALDVAERFAHGEATEEELKAAHVDALDALSALDADYSAAHAAAHAAARATARAAANAFTNAAVHAAAYAVANYKISKQCADIYREVINYDDIEKFLLNTEDSNDD